MQPCISYLILSFNSADWITETLASLYTQGTDDFEVIIVDDASTDATHTLISPFLSDTRVRYFRLSRNQGIGRSLRFGLDRVRGDIICGLGGDDSLEPAHTACVMKLFNRYPEAAVVATGLKTVGANGECRPDMRNAALCPDLPEYLDATSALKACLQHNIITGPGACMRANVTRGILPFFGSSWRFCNDWFLWMLLFSTGFGLASTKEDTVRYRVHNASLSRRSDLAAIRALETRLSPLAGLRFSMPYSRDAAVFWQRYAQPLYALWLLRAMKSKIAGQLPADYVHLGRSLYYDGPPRCLPFILEFLLHIPAIVMAYVRERISARRQPFPCSGMRQVDHPLFQQSLNRNG
jgi:glycosyltransferase involved in cell wall biosynthesis